VAPQNFEKLFEQVKAVNIDNAATLTGALSQIFNIAVGNKFTLRAYLIIGSRVGELSYKNIN
jgi:hypothetical protein